MNREVIIQYYLTLINICRVHVVIILQHFADFSKQGVKHSYFFLFSDKIPIFQGNSYFSYFLAILHLILVFYSLFISISHKNSP